MQVDELRRELSTQIDGAPAPTGNLDTVIRRGRRRVALRRSGGALAVLVVFAAIVTPLVLRNGTPNAPNKVSTGPALRATDLRWGVHDKEMAGLGAGTSLAAVANTGHSLLAAGARPSGPARNWRASIWYSTNGISWTRARVPQTPGEVTAIATDGNRALAVGTDSSGPSNFVWRSEDGGRHWTAIATGARIFGRPAPEMGRPFVSGLRSDHGTWIASGGASSGYAAIWTSDDGVRWDQVLDTANVSTAGSVDITGTADGSLFAYWVTAGWYSADGRSWATPVALSVPDRWFLRTVAPGVAVAFGSGLDHYSLPTPLLRSRDDGRTWTLDPTFLEAFPDASVLTVARTDGLWVAAGTSGQPNHPDAWVSSDLANWYPLPASLYGAPGGTLGLVGVVGDRVVLLGTAPELDRYYTLSLRR
jgi:hypothetical protein